MDRKRFYEGAAGGAKRSAPAALRNRGPIAEVLAKWLPDTGRVLEIASGSGEHAVHFARAFPKLEWQPTDADEDALASIAAWRHDADLSNLRPPLRLDARDHDWGIKGVVAVFSANMVHISPWESALGLIAGAARVLPEGGVLILYGPWLKDGAVTAPSNLEFDADLKRRNPAWGLRRVEDFAKAAARGGFALSDTRPMPANNLMLKLVRSGAKLPA